MDPLIFFRPIKLGKPLALGLYDWGVLQEGRAENENAWDTTDWFILHLVLLPREWNFAQSQRATFPWTQNEFLLNVTVSHTCDTLLVHIKIAEWWNNKTTRDTGLFFTNRTGIFCNLWSRLNINTTYICKTLFVMTEKTLLTWFGTQGVALCVINVKKLLVSPDHLVSGAVRRKVALFQASLQLLNGQQVVHELRHWTPRFANRAAADMWNRSFWPPSETTPPQRMPGAGNQ